MICEEYWKKEMYFLVIKCITPLSYENQSNRQIAYTIFLGLNMTLPSVLHGENSVRMNCSQGAAGTCFQMWDLYTET